MLEKLWNEYLSEECAVIDTAEERELAKKIADLHKKANALMDKEQEEALQRYADALCEMDALFVKKAFVTGCKFAISFLLEARI